MGLIGDFVLIVFAELAAVSGVGGGVRGAVALQLRRRAVHRVQRDGVGDGARVGRAKVVAMTTVVAATITQVQTILAREAVLREPTESGRRR